MRVRARCSTRTRHHRKENEMTTETEAPETMTVTIRDRSAEPPWGSGRTTVITRKATIAAECPTCGERRGQPEGLNLRDDGAWYWVQIWENPCGHLDTYRAVVAEATERGTLGKAVRN